MCMEMKILIFITLHVLICDCRARPRANTLLYTSHPTSCGDIITRYNLPSVGFQRSFYPFCECLSGPHRVSDSSFMGFYNFLKYKCILQLLIWTDSCAVSEALSSFPCFMRLIFTETSNCALSGVTQQCLISKAAARAFGAILLIW